MVCLLGIEDHLHDTWIQVVTGSAWGLLLSLALIRWVAPLGWMDRPDKHRKHHARPTPRTGGMALWLGLVAIQVSSGRGFFGLDLPNWIAIHVMAFIGLLDDRFNLKARYKAIAGLAVSMLLAVHVFQSMSKALDHGIFLGISLSARPILVAPLLMLWFWAIPQAYNLIDGINGLSLGYASLLLGVLGLNLGIQYPLAWGGLVIVMLLNFPKAHHFIGDCGALMLGTLFAILGVQAFGPRDPNLLLWVFAYPIIDVTLVVSIRKWKRQRLSVADRSHLHHWMMEHVHGRSWVATPLLLGLAILPMLRSFSFVGHEFVSTFGLVAILALALKVFWDRTMKHGKRKAQMIARREIPFMLQGALRESGSHPKV